MTSIDAAGQALADEMRADEVAQRAKMEALLPQILHAREAAKLDKELSPVLRQYIALNRREPVINGEAGVIGDLGKGGSTETDCRPLTDEQVIVLKNLGLLDIKWGPLDTLFKAAPTVMLKRILDTPGVRRAVEYDTLRVKRISDA